MCKADCKPGDSTLSIMHTNYERKIMSNKPGEKLSNGITGQLVKIPSANPLNYYQALSTPQEMPELSIDGHLFMPPSGKPLPVIILVPGSLGIAPSHLNHAETFTNMGIAACVIDPFGARKVSSTVANQTQYSFAASAWDVLATAKFLGQLEAIDNKRIGAQGHSRGGSAVLSAASTPFANAFPQPALEAVYAAYPWCGHQFLDPDITSTVVRAVIGDRDEWCLPQQVQGHIHAMQLSGGRASIKIFAGAQHSFDRGTKIELIPNAAVSPAAPTCYLEANGAFIHPVTNVADTSLCDRDLMVYALKAGYGKIGAHLGSKDNQAEAFRADMVRFWESCLSPGES